jgi:large subunit ribosomal protein L19
MHAVQAVSHPGERQAPPGPHSGLSLCLNIARRIILMSDLLLKTFEENIEENKHPQLRPGDSVTVYVRIVEGKRERVQMIRGTVIRLRKGGNQTNFTVRRIASNGIGVELTFLYNSPRIEKIEVHRHAHVRRAQLYFMRERTGKRARLREKRIN